MSLNLLLVNPNSMNTPPVIPIGLEYLATALEKREYGFKILDLCFSSDPSGDLNEHLENNNYDITGFTIRNIDSTVFFHNEFYLPKIKELINLVKLRDIPVILGGAGFSAMPRQILDYFEADYGIVGSAEIMLPRFLDLWKENKVKEKIFDGNRKGIAMNLVHERGIFVDYRTYLDENGIVGFETHRGCSGNCPYCVEAKKKVWFRRIPYIIGELKYLVKKGYDHFHLCDCEFNEDLQFSLEFCHALIEENLDMKWALYMRPTPYTEELIKLLSESKANLITLSVDSDERIQKLNNYTYDDLSKFISFCKKYGIKLAIDLLTGYPDEPVESIKKMFTLFRRNRPSTVGVNFYYRLFKNTKLTALVKNNPSHHIKLSRKLMDGEQFLEPIFYNQYSLKTIKKLINNDDLFKIAGVVPGVNYQQDL